MSCAGYHQPNSYGQGGLDSLTQQTYHAAQEKFDNFTCGRIDLMGNIVTKSAPYLYPFVIEFSLIIAAILLVMWLRIGKNPRSVKQSAPSFLAYMFVVTFFFFVFHWLLLTVENFQFRKLLLPD